jgi:HD-GYP domain-containing protein (c-di-GMP phosphodiesterase class II)
LAAHAAVAVVNTRLFKDARRRLEQLEALRAVDLAITGSTDLRVTLDVLLWEITRQLGVDAALVLLLDGHRQVLEYAASRGFHTATLRYTRLRVGEGNAGRAALSRQIVAIPNIAEAPGTFTHAPTFKQEGFRAYYAAPLLAKGEVKGVLEIFHRARLDPDEEWVSFLETLAGQAALAIDNASLFQDLQRSNAELSLAYDATLAGWSHALDLRDRETEGHTQRVTETTLRLAARMNVPEASLVHLRRGALLHDIGKMGIPDSILHKPGPLSDEEWVIMRKHPTYAYEMLAPIAYLRSALDIPYCHHEKWDGSGYPRGLKGEAIPLAARIFAVVDVWDALCSDRPYRKGWPPDEVLAHIRAGVRTHFDPRVVEAFLQLMAEASGPSAPVPSPGT